MNDHAYPNSGWFEKILYYLHNFYPKFKDQLLNVGFNSKKGRRTRNEAIMKTQRDKVFYFVGWQVKNIGYIREFNSFTPILKVTRETWIIPKWEFNCDYQFNDLSCFHFPAGVTFMIHIRRTIHTV